MGTDVKELSCSRIRGGVVVESLDLPSPAKAKRKPASRSGSVYVERTAKREWSGSQKEAFSRNGRTTLKSLSSISWGSCRRRRTVQTTGYRPIDARRMERRKTGPGERRRKSLLCGRMAASRSRKKFQEKKRGTRMIENLFRKPRYPTGSPRRNVRR